MLPEPILVIFILSEQSAMNLVMFWVFLTYMIPLKILLPELVNGV